MPADNCQTYPRPTLPSLQSLGLPRPVPLSSTALTACDDQETSIRRPEHTTWHRARQSSVSSMTTSCSDTSTRPSSPQSSSSEYSEDRQLSASPPPPIQAPRNSFRLVRSTVEEANAFVLIPPVTVPHVENISSLSRAKAASDHAGVRHTQALLITGPALEYLRHPRIRIARGARVHPYRIVPHYPPRPKVDSSPGSSVDAPHLRLRSP